MIKGGYQLIDLKDIDISSGDDIVSGIYNKIEGNYRKPLLLTGITINGIERPDAYISVYSDANARYITSTPIYGYYFAFNDDDTIEITKTIPE